MPPATNAAEEPNVRVVNMVAERFFFVPSRITVEPGHED